MAAPRSSRVTRSSVGLNGLDENFCGRTLRNRSIAQPEETSPPPTQRTRLPSKKQDCQQNQQAGAQSGKVAEGESLLTHRKRGLSVSEKDEPERSDTSERVRAGGGQEASPSVKRAKRCSRSGELQGTEEESSPKPESPDPATAKSNDEDSKSDFAPNSPSDSGLALSVSLDKECEEEKDEDKERGPSLPASGSHKATNGLAEVHADDLESAALPAEPCACPTTLMNSPLPNGSQVAASTLDPIVPCTAPLLKQVGESNGLQADRKRNCLAEEASEAVLSLEPEVEVEVDVVGDTGQIQDEHVAEEGANNGLLLDLQDPSDECSNISGETAGLTSQLPAEPPSFTEPQEHRYTLRTSPRRTSCVSGPRCSSPKPGSPHADNGLLKEEVVVVPLGLDDSAFHKEPPTDGPSLVSEADRELSEHIGAKANEDTGLLERKVSRSTKQPSVEQAEEEELEEDEPDVYYFESDHLALKHNKDYQRLLQTISVLEAQRTQAILDLEVLACHQKQALTNPVAFVDHLQKQVELGLPCPQRVVQLPEIAWDQYTSGRSEFERDFCDKKRKTRQLKLIFDKVGLPARPKSPIDSKKESDGSSLYSSLPFSDAPEQSLLANGSQMIRGRPCQNKTDTFNQLWTVEEQKKLEQLLLKFPPEEVESKRWQKIADELGNRTSKQVASRVQKYFIKLTKAGIPVPGRTPNLCMYNKKTSTKRQHHLNKHLYRPSTFLTSYEPPVYMEDEDERASFISSLQDGTAHDSDEDDVPVELRHLPEYKELQELKRLRKRKIHEIQSESALTQHIGFKVQSTCDLCGIDPIQGVRWHCQDCPQDNSVDFCADCAFKTDTHPQSHRLEPVQQAESFLDRDYCLPASASYNYLDPNYFPANR